MKHRLLTLLICLFASNLFADNILIEGFEYGNHDLGKPIGWTCNDNAWMCGYLEKDHNRAPHSGNWYAFAEAGDSWMFMPIFLPGGMKYRINCWAVSDGSFQLEFWACSAPRSDAAVTQLLAASVESGEYELMTSYVDTFQQSCDFIAVRAVGGNGANCLTIDDIEVFMVEQYTFEAEPITGDTSMYPGSEATFRFLVHNTGYDPVSITAHPSNEFFTNISCHVDGVSTMTFPTEPDETVEVTVNATLRPEIEPGTVAWLDIQMTIPCNCNTAMVTFWVTPIAPTQVTENNLNVSVFPNPATDFVTIEAEGLQQIEIHDLSGKTVKSITACGNTLQLDLNELKAGIYLISAKTRSTSAFVKPILKM